MSAFMKSIDTKVLGRKTYEHGLRMGATFDTKRVEPSSSPVMLSR